MTDEERYRLTHELFMLSTMRFHCGVQIHIEKVDLEIWLKREEELIYRLGLSKINPRLIP